jgi:site-specific DNA-methyltransferase (adenine-specific)
VVQNVLAHGTGALNIAGCKVPHASAAAHAESENKNRHADFGSGPRQHQGVYVGMPAADRAQYDGADGRWPPNLALGETAAAELDRQSGTTTSRVGQPRQSAKPGDGYGMTHTGAEYADTGGASRFYPVFRYQAKAPTAERPRLEDGTSHPTVKPVGLMSWLVRLVTRPGGLVLDPFAGSGATAEACVVEGFRCVLIEKDPKSVELIRTRLRKDIQPDLFGSGGAA